MKIFHVISSLDIGGAECFVAHLANEQIKKHKVGIVILKKGNIHTLSFENDLDPGIQLFKLNWTKKYSIIQAVKLTRFFKKQDPDVVHVHLHNPFYYVYFSSWFINGIRFINTFHTNLSGWDKVLKIVDTFRIINNKITHVCLTDSIYNETVLKYPALNLTMINNGIPDYQVRRSNIEIESFWNNFDRGPAMHRFLAIGNLSMPKNYPFMCKVFKRLMELKIPAILIIIGKDSDPEQKISREIKEIDAENVFLAGPLKNAPDFLLKAEALLLGSLIEGMPITVIESFSLGKPVISTPAGGMADLIKDGINGYLLKDWTVENYVLKLIDYINSPEDQKNTIGKNAKLYYAENLQIDKISEKYLQVYKD